MAKSKLVKWNKKIEEKAVDGYSRIESAVVGKYQQIEDTFVDQFLTRDHETIEEAKIRLKKEKDMRCAEHEKK